MSILRPGYIFEFRGLVGQARQSKIYARVQGATLSGQLVLEIASSTNEFDPDRTIHIDYYKFIRLVQERIWQVTPETQARVQQELDQSANDMVVFALGFGSN